MTTSSVADRASGSAKTRLQLSARTKDADREARTYTQILRSTCLIGASSVVSIAVGIVRMKAMAVLLGPPGVGLMALYSSIIEMVQNLAGMGIQSSGVRQIAEAVGTEDIERIGRTGAVLKRVALVLGLIGASLVVGLSRWISQLTFGSQQQAIGVALLSIVVLLREVSAGQAALIQGMRRISDMARMNVLVALFGSVIAVSAVYVWGANGIVPSLIALAVVSLVASFWYGRRVHIQRARLTFLQLRQETVALLKLGFAFMASGFLTMAVAYAVRLIVVRNLGFDAAGLYQAAWALGGLYVGFILQAMGADFYPRLTAVCKNNAECNRLVNEQAQISLLLAGPGVIATLAAAPLVLSAFYSAEFHAAVGLLRWICLGMLLRVVAWPMGFIVLAKGAQQVFLWTEIAATVVHVGLAWLLVRSVGVDGAGMAFFGVYVWHGLLIYAVVRQIAEFRWSAANLKLGMLFLPAAGTVFFSFYLLPAWLAIALGAVTSLLTAFHSARTLLTLVPPEATHATIRTWLPRLGLATRGPAPTV